MTKSIAKKSTTGSLPPAVPLAITPTFSPWTHTSDDSYIYHLSLVLATATASFIRQCYKQRWWPIFTRTTAYNRFISWLYCHANNNCWCHPSRLKRFYFGLNVLIPKWWENLCCGPSIPRLNIMVLLIHRHVYDAMPVAQQAEVAATNKLV